jgi:hypothetical protein
MIAARMRVWIRIGILPRPLACCHASWTIYGDQDSESPTSPTGRTSALAGEIIEDDVWLSAGADQSNRRLKPIQLSIEQALDALGTLGASSNSSASSRSSPASARRALLTRTPGNDPLFSDPTVLTSDSIQ